LQPLIQDHFPAGEKVRSKYPGVARISRGARQTLCASKHLHLARFAALAG
jgi:hypothetical protein